jgi:hypothetical protein
MRIYDRGIFLFFLDSQNLNRAVVAFWAFGEGSYDWEYEKTAVAPNRRTLLFTFTRPLMHLGLLVSACACMHAGPYSLACTPAWFIACAASQVGLRYK